MKYAFGRLWPETWVDNNPSWIHDGAYGFSLSSQRPVKNIAGLSVPTGALGIAFFHILVPGF